MRWKKSVGWLALLFWLTMAPAHGAEPATVADEGGKALAREDAVKTAVPSTYVIGVGDVLQLSVWKDTALSRQMVVLPDGTVSLPLSGLVTAAGKTVAQLETEVAGKIKRYMTDPVLDISVVQANSMIIYIVGKVQSPGRFPVATDVNILQALAMAGGPNRFADTDNIRVHREEGGKTVFLDFDYDAVLKGVHMEQNIRLRRGDVVVVP
ncbi:polysaccharide biosynthesis/export family protein [Desulfobulbus elongatus]|uniref:polysaccharide biosynthesis/export family protein n=1 Tax=Desulfobulbus elongatus TaxID=53332 RepID=UPI0006878AED|nr:polysaccharide biosynthesis/export family protein [Desulfobulbus elongatus]